ncbi:MAG: MFS transporter [Alphaproteobacteria bacterium]|nr:MFS transporter [Alphaproteobacteria bacterium]
MKVDSLKLIKNPSQVTSDINVPAFQKWVVWGVASLFYLYELMLRVSPSVMTDDLMRDFQVSSTSLGVLASFYYWAYVPLQIPCGLIVDRFGTRRIITFSAFLCILGTFLFAESHTLFMAQVGRFLIGAGSACAFLSCLKVTVEWFPIHQFALIAGLTNMMGTFGGIAGGRPLATLVNTVGWRRAGIYMALFGLVVMAVSWLFIRDKPSAATTDKESAAIQFLPTLKGIVKNPQIWLAGMIGGFMYLPISAFAELWAVPFLMNNYGINNELASTASVMIFVGMGLGGPAAAWLMKYSHSYSVVMKFSSLITAGLFVLITYAEYISLGVMFGLILLAGFTIGGQVLCFTCAQDHCTQENSGTAMGFTNAVVMMSGIIFQPALGAILDLVWDGQVSAAGIRVYSHNCYQMALISIPISLFISWILLKFVKEDRRIA